MQHVIYQVEYRKALKTQVTGILEQLQANEFETVSEYLTKCYEDGFVGTMYDMQGQGIPLVIPIDQEQAAAAIQLESKISEGLYTALGKDVATLRKQIASEISRGISGGQMYSEIVRNLAGYAGISRNRAMNIVRTDGHRIQCKATADAQYKAKEKGADVVKQWDSTLDGKTRETHRQLDGQIRELDEPFEVAGMSAMQPGGFNNPAEDCNCRCALLQRARWALGEEELHTLEERAEYFGLDKTKDFEEFKEKYLKAVEKNENSSIIIDKNTILEQNEIIEQARTFGEDLLNHPELIAYDNGEPISNYVNKQIDYDGLPNVVSASEFNVLSNGKQVLYRGVSDYKDITSEKMVEDFKNGSFYCGRGVYGNGTYLDIDKSVANYYAFQAGETNNGSIMEMLLSDDAKTVSYIDIYKEWEKTGIYKLTANEREAYQDVIGDVGTYAAIKGYDAIILDGWQGKNHVVVLNRSKVIIKE